MIQNKLKTTLKMITLSFLIFSSGAFAMKKADFIKALNEQIIILEAERAVLLASNVSSTEYVIILLNAEIDALIAERDNA